jgi:hypothetical protein
VTDLAHRCRIWLVIAASMLLMNALGASLASASVTDVAMDAFGNPLCITSTADDGATPPGDHHKVPSCCTLGCNMGSTVVAAEAEMAAQILWPRHQSFAPPIGSLIRLPSPDYDPGNPRAPPLTA